MVHDDGQQARLGQDEAPPQLQCTTHVLACSLRRVAMEVQGRHPPQAIANLQYT